MNEEKIVEVVLKDQKTLDFYNKRNKLLEIVIESYELRKDYFRTAVISANMERIHVQSMIDKAVIAKELNEAQTKGRYNLQCEEEIMHRCKDLANNDWTDSERKTILGYQKRMFDLSESFKEKMSEFHKIQSEIPDQNQFHQGREIIAKVQLCNDPK